MRRKVHASLCTSNTALLKAHDDETFDMTTSALEEQYKDVEGFPKVMDLYEPKMRALALHPLAGTSSLTNNAAESLNHQFR